MGEFRQHLQGFRPSQPMSEMDNISMEMTKQSSELNSTLLMENFSIADFTSLETLLAHHQIPEFPASCTHTLLAGRSLTAIPAAHTVTVDEDVLVESKKRKSMEQSTRNFENISPAVSTTEFGGNTNIRKKDRLGKGKKARINVKEPEKEEDVIHVRARRGQATDSHSLAERVRRGKINEKMRCLQSLVPGCHKTMGMSMMLEEIINYVHSLQNQVELAAASSSHDLNLETECIKKAQWTNSHVAQQVEKWARDRYGEQNCFHSTWPL